MRRISRRALRTRAGQIILRSAGAGAEGRAAKRGASWPQGLSSARRNQAALAPKYRWHHAVTELVFVLVVDRCCRPRRCHCRSLAASRSHRLLTTTKCLTELPSERALLLGPNANSDVGSGRLCLVSATRLAQRGTSATSRCSSTGEQGLDTVASRSPPQRALRSSGSSWR